jgi:hypothetical protein
VRTGLTITGVGGVLLALTACGTLLSVDDEDTPKPTPPADAQSAPHDASTATSDAGQDAAVEPGDAAPDGPRPKVVFVTAAVRNGALGGVDGGDALCNAEATTSALAGTFVAYLQSEAGGPGHPALRLADHRWARVDGKVVFETNPKNQVPKHPLVLKADGNALPAGQAAWTGVSGSVTYYCGPNGGPQWTTTTPQVNGAGWGDPSATTAAWQTAGGDQRDCSESLHLYCFEK